jgi:hypothetical protein
MLFMKSVASHFPLLVTTALLFACMIGLATARMEYCGQPEALRPRCPSLTAMETRSPTLAPPHELVFVHVEADKPDLEVGWAGN